MMHNVAYISGPESDMPAWCADEIRAAGIALSCKDCNGEAETEAFAKDAELVWMRGPNRGLTGAVLGRPPACRAIFRSGSGLDALPCDETAADDAATAAIRAELWRALAERVFAESRMGETSKAVFMKLVADEVPVERLCAEYGMTPNAIYRLRHRMTAKLREKWLSIGGDGTDLYDALEILARDLARG